MIKPQPKLGLEPYIERLTLSRVADCLNELVEVRIILAEVSVIAAVPEHEITGLEWTYPTRHHAPVGKLSASRDICHAATRELDLKHDNLRQGWSTDPLRKKT